MAFNFFNNTFADSLSKTNNQVNKMQGGDVSQNMNPNKPIQDFSKQNNQSIGIGGDDNQVMGETPWWNWEWGEGEMGGLGGNPYSPPPGYGGGNTGSFWTEDNVATWSQLQQDMISSGYIDSYNFDWESFQESFQDWTSDYDWGYNDFWSYFLNTFGPHDEGQQEEQEEQGSTLASGLANGIGKKRARNLYYSDIVSPPSRGFSSYGNIEGGI